MPCLSRRASHRPTRPADSNRLARFRRIVEDSLRLSGDMHMPITVWGLAIAQALLTSGNILLVSVSALIGQQLAAHPALITLPVAVQFLGLIMATLPAAHLMQRLGRKAGFVLGNLIGLAGTWVA